MDATTKQLFSSFKRLIHVLTAGKKSPKEYAGVWLHKAEVHLVEMIGDVPGVTVSAIAGNMGVTKGAVSQIIKKLVDKNLIEKRPDEADRKVQALHLSPLGRVVYDEHEAMERELVQAILKDLEPCRPEDIKAFTSVCDRVSDYSGK